MIKLSILIPSIFDRKEMLGKLLDDLYDQMLCEAATHEVEIITDVDDGILSIGKKRQGMIERAKGEYVVQVDDDDELPNYYIKEILKAMEENPDVIGFDGYMTTNGKNRENFKISKDLPYTSIWDAHGNKEYVRFNNHLSPIKREIALNIGFKDMRFGEDYDYAKRLKESGLVKTEVYIHKDMYHYKYIKNK